MQTGCLSTQRHLRLLVNAFLHCADNIRLSSSVEDSRRCPLAVFEIQFCFKLGRRLYDLQLVGIKGDEEGCGSVSVLRVHVDIVLHQYPGNTWFGGGDEPERERVLDGRVGFAPGG